MEKSVRRKERVRQTEMSAFSRHTDGHVYICTYIHLFIIIYVTKV